MTDPDFPPLIDVSKVSLADLITSDVDALSRCIQRLVEALDDPDGIISAFQNFAS